MEPLVRIPPELVASFVGQPDIDYALDRPPWTKYYWNGVSLAPIGSGTVTIDGISYLTAPDGSLIPLLVVSGTPHEPMVAGAVEQQVVIDSGNDANDHVEVLLTFNAWAGNPDTADTDLASARFTTPNSNAEVIKTAITGPTSATVLTFSGPITMLHVALRGAGPYTQAAGNVCTALQMVLMKFAMALDVNVVEVRVGSSYVGGGAGKRYRQITVTGYSA